MRTPSLLDTAPRFDGAAFDLVLGQDRLSKQLARIFDLMSDGRWRTLQEIADATAIHTPASRPSSGAFGNRDSAATTFRSGAAILKGEGRGSIASRSVNE